MHWQHKESCAMNGNRYVLDTSAIIAMLNGNSVIFQLVHDAVFIGISIISVLEFLSFDKLNEQDKQTLFELISETEVINLTIHETALFIIITQMRNSNKLKLPDAIIAGTAVYKNATLTTGDRHFQNIPNLSVLYY